MTCISCPNPPTKLGYCASHYNKEYYAKNRAKVNARNTENYRKGRVALNANKAEYRKLLKLIKTVSIAELLTAVDYLRTKEHVTRN